jgi:hypothetical protein
MRKHVLRLKYNKYVKVQADFVVRALSAQFIIDVGALKKVAFTYTEESADVADIWVESVGGKKISGLDVTRYEFFALGYFIATRGFLEAMNASCTH